MPSHRGASPLQLTCPKCGLFGKHPVTRTDPRLYTAHCTLANGQTTTCAVRIREKRCSGCNWDFNSAEVILDDLELLVDEVRPAEPRGASRHQAVDEFACALETLTNRIQELQTELARLNRAFANRFGRFGDRGFDR